MLALLCSCADMGVGEEQDSFQKYFSNVILLSHSGRSERSIAAFNAAVTYENSTEIRDVIGCADYCYVAFEVADGYTVTVDEFAFCARSDGDTDTLELEFYVTDQLPTKIDGSDSTVYFPEKADKDNATYTPETDPNTGLMLDRENGERGDSDVFNSENRYHTDSMSISAQWDSKLLEFDAPQTVHEGEYIVIRVKNNCTAAEKSDRVPFTINYLMFHFTAVEQE